MHLHGITLALVVLSLVAALGLALGQLRLGGVRLGVGGALFAGLALAHFGITVDPALLGFAREFGLVLFVYAIGVTVGPGFFLSFKKDGLALNGLAVLIVLLGSGLAAALHLTGLVDLPAALGLLAGAVTNTPSLAAGQQVLLRLGGGAGGDMLGQAYAVAYPFGIVGILLSMLGLRFAFRLDPAQAAQDFETLREAGYQAVETVNLEVKNPAVAGCRLRDLDELKQMGVVLSRVLHDGTQHVLHADDILSKGDVVLAVGPQNRLEFLTRLIGPVARIDLKSMKSSDVTWERMVVTQSAILGKSLGELDLRARLGMVISRISRQGHDLVPDARLKLQFGDMLTVVGDPANMGDVAKLVGNRSKALQETQLIPIFAGIVLGLLLGAVPFSLPGLPAPIQLGMAGGPLVAAIALSRLGHLGPMVWFMPPAANHFMRDLGIALFLAAVGLKSGHGFADTLIHGQGLRWMGAGMLVTLVPLVIAALIGQLFLKLNYLTLCGVLAGSMTDPPALAFAQGLAGSEAAILSYASVYPLTMVLRVMAPQILAILLWM